MSLIKQLWLAVIFIIALAFSASFIINMMTSKQYLEQQLEMKNIDNAVSLALSMSQMEKDPVSVELMLSAQFDNGHYEYIKLTDPNNQLINERVNSQVDNTVPAWFQRLVSISVQPGVAQVQDGWNQYGSLALASSTRFAYQDLWSGTLSMVLWSALIALLCGILGSLVLNVIMQPLQEMVKMTDAIGDKNFITIDEPKTTEFQSLANGLNHLSQRIKNILKEQSLLLDQMRLEANYDSNTGLMNRKYFMSSVSTHLEDDDHNGEGLLIVCHISNLAEINQTLGESGTNGMLHNMGTALLRYCEAHPTLIPARISGADFAVFSSKTADSQQLSSEIRSTINAAADLESKLTNFALPTVSSSINKSSDLDDLISAINAKTQNASIDILALNDAQGTTSYDSKGEASWKAMLAEAINAKRFKQAMFPVISDSGEVIHYEGPSRLQLTEGGPWLVAGEFMEWALKLRLVPQIDLLALETAVESLKEDKKLAIGLNVSTYSMANSSYQNAIKTLLKNNKSVAKRLWLEVTETCVFNEMSAFKSFCTSVKPLGCKIGVEHIGPQIGRLGELLDLNLDYIKIDASFIRDINKNSGNQAFLKGICLSAHSIGLITIAEGVQTDEELTVLVSLGVNAMTGPAMKQH